MQRSATQILYRYLPDAVFSHEDGFIAKVHLIRGPRVTNINRDALLDEIAEELQRWDVPQRGIPDPRINPDEYIFIEPEQVVWDLFPLTFECRNRTCGRVRRWFDLRTFTTDVDRDGGQLRCRACNSRMRQVRYVTAHNCGDMKPLHTPTCPNCNNPDNMHLEDLGSFRSSSWRCHACGFAVGTRFTPCNCNQYAGATGRSYQQGYTERDSRLWYPQTITMLNISAASYTELQGHPSRGAVALASWLGDQPNIANALVELGAGGSTGGRLTQEAWVAVEANLRAANTDEDVIEQVRQSSGPLATGATALSATMTPALQALAETRGLVERAGLFDLRIIDDRKSVADVANAATAAGVTAVAAANAAEQSMHNCGIADISVTQRFPIVAASYGYSRSQRSPGLAHLRSYSKSGQYGGKTPIFAVPAETEALLVTLDAETVLQFLEREGAIPASAPRDARTAKLQVAEILAADGNIGTDDPAGIIRRIVHSTSHAMLRALDDGQSGFGESSLAEWIVPDALTFAVYVASYNNFTLGAFDTVLRRRISMWLDRATEGVAHCDNDPMCSQTSSHKPHAACDRCLHLSFGCPTWNADLDRKLLRRFWLTTRVLSH